MESAVPPYSFLVGAAALTFLLFIIRFKYPLTDLGLTMFLMLNIVCSAVMINLIVIEAKQASTTKELSVSTAILMASGGLQVVSTIGCLIALARIQDP